MIETIGNWLMLAEQRDIAPIEADEIDRLVACPASAALPHSRRTTDGFAAVLRQAIWRSVSDAATLSLGHGLDREQQLMIADVADTHIRLPYGAVGPLHFALTRQGAHLLTGAPTSKGVLLTATADVLWSDPAPLRREDGRLICPEGSRLVVGSYQHPSRRRATLRNAPLAAAATLAALWSGAERCDITSVVVDGGVDIEEPERLDVVSSHLQLRQLCAQVEQQRHEHELAAPIMYCMSEHCLTCPADLHCGLLIGYIRQVANVPSRTSRIEPEQARELVHELSLLHRASSSIRSTLVSYVKRHGPIELGDGRVWGQLASRVHRIDGQKARRLLEQKVGRGLAAELQTYTDERSVKRVLSRARREGLLPRPADESYLTFLGMATRVGATETEDKHRYGHHGKAEEAPSGPTSPQAAAQTRAEAQEDP